jgi:DNA-binding helix-hairpin-helix protein with protein kinase domain
MTIDFEVRQRAEELYILEGLTLMQVAERTGVPESTAKRWSSEGGWFDKRREYRRAQGEIRRNTVLYRLAILQKAMQSLHAQDAFAWASVEKTATDKILADAAAPALPQREIRTAQEAIDALQEAVERKLTVMLAQPDTLSLKAVKEVKDAMLTVDELKSRYSQTPEEAKRRGLSDETVEDIKRKILGMT